MKHITYHIAMSIQHSKYTTFLQVNGYEVVIDNIIFGVARRRLNGHGMRWTVSDLASGLAISHPLRTRDAAIKDAETHMDGFRGIQQTDMYKNLVEKLKKYKEKHYGTH